MKKNEGGGRNNPACSKVKEKRLKIVYCLTTMKDEPSHGASQSNALRTTSFKKGLREGAETHDWFKKKKGEGSTFRHRKAGPTFQLIH